MTIQGVTGEQRVPVAEIKLFSPHFGCDEEISVEVGLVKHMINDVLLGNDLFEENSKVTDVISVNYDKQANCDILLDNDNREKRSKLVHAVTTRSQTIGDQESREKFSEDTEPNISLSDDESVVEQRVGVSNEQSFDSTGDGSGSDMSKGRLLNQIDSNVTNLTVVVDGKTRSNCTPDNSNANTNSVRNTSRCDFIKMQQQDESLKPVFKLALAGSDKYFIEDGVLFRRAIGGCNMSDDKLLCAPSRYREQLVRIAHDSMWSAHSGAKRTPCFSFQECIVLLQLGYGNVPCVGVLRQ